jgi:hypothetical protein
MAADASHFLDRVMSSFPLLTASLPIKKQSSERFGSGTGPSGKRPIFSLGRCNCMKHLNADYYRREADKCRMAAALAKGARKQRWLKIATCWTILANQAELATLLLEMKKKPD